MEATLRVCNVSLLESSPRTNGEVTGDPECDTWHD